MSQPPQQVPPPVDMLAALERATSDPGKLLPRGRYLDAPGEDAPLVALHTWQAQAVMCVILGWGVTPARTFGALPVPRDDQPHLVIVGARWWTPAPPAAGYSGLTAAGQVCAVLRHDTITGNYQAYIGRTAGRDEASEIQVIAKWGAKIDPDLGRAMFPAWAG